MSLLAVDDLRVRYGRGAGALLAVDGVSFAVEAGASLGIVGESGSGKSTIARAIVQLVPSAGGRITLSGRDVTNATGSGLRHVRDSVQMVFQDPFATLHPRRTIGASLREAIGLHARRADAGAARFTVAELLDRVTLGAGLADRYPHELSGGQLQRVGIAVQLAARPRVMILDEVTSALDVSVQAAVLNLLRDLRDELDLTYVCISHDLAVISYLCTDVVVVYLGQIVEHAPWPALVQTPRHHYTRALLDSVPQVHGAVARPAMAAGDVPDPRNPPSGCRYHPRCAVGPLPCPARTNCVTDAPLPRASDEDAAHLVRCHYPLAGEPPAAPGA
jgi:peptide/nickel transport system ATP-binding protein